MFKKGDSIRIKDGVCDPDYPEIEIGGWQGRIFELEGADETGQELYTIAWDSISLKSLDAEIILESIEAGIDYAYIALYGNDIEKAAARDTEKDVEAAIAALEEEFFWSDLGEQGERIRQVLATAKSKSETDMLKAWEAHLKKSLKFPIAVVFVGEANGPFKEGAKFSIQGIDSITEIMGIMVTAKMEKGTQLVPLCDLDVETESAATESMYDYCIWYANH